MRSKRNYRNGFLLTQVLNPFLIKFGYFNRKNLPLKKLFIFAALVLPSLAVFAQSYNNIEFIENKGQWDDRVQYRGNVSNGAFFIRKDGGFTVLQHNPGDFASVSRFLHGQKADGTPVGANDKIVLRSHAYNVDFIGVSSSAKTIPEKPIQSYNNYFIGADPSNWSSDCRIYQVITLKDVYPNIDVRYYTDNEFLKYDIIVKPGGDVSKIALKYDGISKLQVKNKELVLSTAVGELRESSPYTYQSGAKGREEVGCKYIVKDNIVRFEVKNYDPNAVLVIDPSIIFCSFSGSSADNWGFTATYGPDGSMFGGGIVFDGGNFPVSPGAFQTTFGGGSTGGTTTGPIDMGIIKLSPDGRNRVYATYIGGSGNEQPHSLIVDPQGNLVIAGRSNSVNYPGTKIGSGGNFDIVVSKLNAAGTTMIGSRMIGGSGDDGVNISATRGLQSLQRNYGDDGRSEVILDGAGNIYVASCSQSPGDASGAGKFPTTAGSFQPNFAGGLQDGVLLKFTPTLSALSFASFVGGDGNDAAYVLSIGPAGNIYVAGGTDSRNFIGSQAGTVGPSNNLDGAGNPTIDGFIAVVNSTGNTIVRSTFIGTSGIDQVFGIQFDNNGFPYVMGQTTGNFPVFNAAYSNAGGKQFIGKLQADLSAYVYSTVFGTGSVTPNISPIAFLVDRCENVYISGWGGHLGSSNVFASAGTTGLPITPDAFKSATDGKDLYFFVLKRDATAQLFGSFFGENNPPQQGGCDHVDGGTSRFDRNGVIYQAICGNCKLNFRPVPVYPVTTGAWSTTNVSNNCNLTMVKIAMNLAGVAGGVQSAIDGVARDTAGCVPLTVDFRDTIANAVSYEWYFDYVPGNPPNLTTTTPNAQFTFTTVGVHQVMLVAIDPASCNVRDSSLMNIRVGATQALPVFTATRLDPCQEFRYRFDNTTIEPPTHPFPATDTSFIWDFGDGSPKVRAGNDPVFHRYASAGSYRVVLTLSDTMYCNSPDDTLMILDVAENVQARIAGPDKACVGQAVQFTNNSLGGDTYVWDFGDGNSSTDREPTHTYTAANTYTVRLTASNPGTCNKVHDTTFVIRVFDVPNALATFAPSPPLVNTPTTFTNLSTNAVSFKWLFGDGDSIVIASLQPVSHQYNVTGTWDALLIAYNQAGCTDTFPMRVSSLIDPLLDVPNAFTPQSGDVNSVIMVRGFGITKMKFIIWNRWGQKVFETSDRNKGWDGRFKGVVQPMDVYVYTLEAEFFDGKKLTKKGDITLIR